MIDQPYLHLFTFENTSFTKTNPPTTLAPSMIERICGSKPMSNIRSACDQHLSPNEEKRWPKGEKDRVPLKKNTGLVKEKYRPQVCGPWRVSFWPNAISWVMKPVDDSIKRVDTSGLIDCEFYVFVCVLCRPCVLRFHWLLNRAVSTPKEYRLIHDTVFDLGEQANFQRSNG